MKSSILFTFLLLLFRLPVYAQNTCPYNIEDAKADTVTTERYYPLETGFEFEYSSFNSGLYFDGIWKRTVLNDTLIEGIQFYKIKEEYHEVIGDSIYESSTTNFIYESNIDGILRTWNSTWGISEITRLNQDFFSCYIPQDNPFDIVISSQIGDSVIVVPDMNGYSPDSIIFEAGKLLQTNLTETLYVPDLGKIESKAEVNNIRILTYAKLGSKIMGRRGKDIFKARTNIEDENPISVSILGSVIYYPQPATDKLFLQIENKTDDVIEGLQIDIYDVIGRLVMRYYEPIYHLNRPIQLDVSNISAGSYFMQIHGKERKTGPLIIFSKIY